MGAIVRNGIVYGGGGGGVSSWDDIADKPDNLVLYEEESAQTGSPISPTLHQSDLVANLTTTIAGSPLDATQGKVLKDYVDTLVINHTRRNISSDLSNLTTAVAEQNLAKYGYAIGDYFVGTTQESNNYEYILADMDTFYGGYSNMGVKDTHHIGIIVNTKTESKWDSSNSTTNGYANSTLRTYLEGTVLTRVKADFKALFGGSTGGEHILSHNKQFTTSNTSRSWTLSEISALTEAQIFGLNIYGMNGVQTGEAYKKLDVFSKFNYAEIFDYSYATFWLRSIASGIGACYVSGIGACEVGDVENEIGAVGFILFT